MVVGCIDKTRRRERTLRGIAFRSLSLSFFLGEDPDGVRSRCSVGIHYAQYRWALLLVVELYLKRRGLQREKKPYEGFVELGRVPDEVYLLG